MKYVIVLAVLGAALVHKPQAFRLNGNVTAAAGIEPARRNGTCQLPPDEGMCKGLIPRYYFNTTTGYCSMFYYGGCQGNDNNFETIEECQVTCGDPERVSDIEGVDFETGCEPAPDSGSCDGELVRWFYNATLKACDTFIYGGCGGNDNNYESQVECKMACKEMLNGPHAFHLHRNATAAAETEPARSNDSCRLPPAEGMCRGLIPRYYFDTREGYCSMFYYGGCQGNDNNFETIEECEETCGDPERVSDFEGVDFETGCLPAPDSGSCDGQLVRWFYNATLEVCDTFYYGGCGGNDNNYASQVECMACKLM